MRASRAGLLILLALLLPCAALGESFRMDVYVYDPCGGCGTVGVGCKSCTIIDEIANRYRLMFPDEPPEIVFHNLRMDRSLEAENDAKLEAIGADPEAVGLPVVWIGDAAFQADGSMDEAIRAYVDSGLTDYPGIEEMLREKAEYRVDAAAGTVVYLYSPYCEDCKDVSRWLKFSVPPEYEVAAYDIYTEQGQEMEKYLLEELGVPGEDYRIPFVAYGTYWFAGTDAIYLSLKSRIQEHPGLATAVISTEGE